MFAKKFDKSLPAVNCMIAAIGLIACVSAQAEIYGGVNFPGGVSSFADAVVSYDPTFGGATGPQLSAREPLNALGIPTGSFVTLGDGGRITLRFTDNSLTGSGFRRSFSFCPARARWRCASSSAWSTARSFSRTVS